MPVGSRLCHGDIDPAILDNAQTRAGQDSQRVVARHFACDANSSIRSRLASNRAVIASRPSESALVRAVVHCCCGCSPAGGGGLSG